MRVTIKALMVHGLGFLRGDTIFRRVLFGSSWMISANVIMMVFALAQSALIARFLGPERYGVLALVIAYTASIKQFLDSKVGETVVKFIIKYREKGDPTRATAVIKVGYLVDTATAGLAFLIIFLTAGVAARLFIKNPWASGLVRLYATTVLITIPSGTSSALLRIGNRFDRLAQARVIISGFRLAAVLAAVALEGGIIGILIAYLLSEVLSALLLLIFGEGVTRQLGLGIWWKTPVRLLQDEYRQMLRFLVATNGKALFELLQGNAILLLVGYWGTPVQVGYLRFASSIARLLSFPIGPFAKASYPEFARLWSQRKVSALKRISFQLVFLSTSVAFATLIFVYINGARIIILVGGEQYLPSLPVLRWLALGVTIGVLTNYGHPLLLSIDQAYSSVIATALGVVTQLAVLTLLFPYINISAAGVGYVAYHLIWICVFIVTLLKMAKKRTKPYHIGST